jgi:hypothetical protein
MRRIFAIRPSSREAGLRIASVSPLMGFVVTSIHLTSFHRVEKIGKRVEDLIIDAPEL